MADLVQVSATGVLLALAWGTPDAAVALGIGVVTAGTTLLIRRGMRVTSTFRKVTLAAVSCRAALAVVAGCALVLLLSSLLGGRALAGALAPWLVSWAAVSSLLSVMLRVVPVAPMRRFMLRALRPDIALVGRPDRTRPMSALLLAQGCHRVVAEYEPARPADIARLTDRAARGEIDKVVLVDCGQPEVEAICFALGDTPTLVCLGFMAPVLSSRAFIGLYLGHLPPFLPLIPSPMSDWRCLLKRVMDVGIVLAIVPLLLPVLLLAALAIKLESPGPVFFRQWRFGLGSRPTRILKFRTMYQDRGDQTGEARTLARDPRVTPVGRILRRTSIDELPQLLNVLRGEMSLVGPRPHATHMKVGGNYYFEAVEGYRMRHRVMPGITGWAQVTGSRGEVDTMEKALERVQKDLWYVRNWSLRLDLRILLMTALGRFASPTAD